MSSRTTTKTWAKLINMTRCANYMASIGKALYGGIDFFVGMLDMTIVNSWVLYKESNMESLPLLDFRRELALVLLTLGMKPNCPVPGALKRRKSSFSVLMSVVLNNLGVHWPQFLPKKGRCEVCSQNSIESRPYSICSHCGVHLCCNSSKMCFRVYHT